MPDIRQNFSIAQGTDLVVEYDIGPDTTGLNLEFADVVVQFWRQSFGVPADEPPILVKDKTSGVEITDPLFLLFNLVMTPDDTEELTPGNYFYKVLIVNNETDKLTYPTYGFMTVLRAD